MHRTDSRAGEHRDGGFGDHRHVNEHAVIGCDAVFYQHIGEPAYVLLELAVSEHPFVAGFAFPDDRRLVATRPNRVAVHAILADIKLAAVKPFRVRWVPIEDLRPRFMPNELLRLARPELLGLGDRLLIELVVGLHRLDTRLGGKLLGWQVDNILIVAWVGLLGAHGL